MVRDMLRLAVAVLAELDASADTEEVLTPSLNDARPEHHARQRVARQAKVRNWGESDDVDWSFIQRTE